MYAVKNTLLHCILKTKMTINKHEIDRFIFHRLFQAKHRSLYKRLFKNPIIFWKSSNAHSGCVLLRYCIGGVTLALLGNLGVIFLSYLPSRMIWPFLITLETVWNRKPTSCTLKEYISTSPIVIMTLTWISAKATFCNFYVCLQQGTSKRLSEVSILSLHTEM